MWQAVERERRRALTEAYARQTARQGDWADGSGRTRGQVYDWARQQSVTEGEGATSGAASVIARRGGGVQAQPQHTSGAKRKATQPPDVQEPAGTDGQDDSMVSHRGDTHLAYSEQARALLEGTLRVIWYKRPPPFGDG